MNNLSEKACTACRAGSPGLEQEELNDGLKQLPGWELVHIDGVPQLRRVYAFSNFVAAMKFAQTLGELAETYGHHPALLVEWGRLEVRWWTHKIKGVHENDLIMAAKSEAAYADLAS